VHSTPSKRTRTAGVKKNPRRGATRPRTAAPTADDLPPVDTSTQVLFDTDLRHRMISEAAFHLYTQRGYVDGYDLDDWLQAEAQIDELIMNPEREDTPEVSARLASP